MSKIWVLVCGGRAYSDYSAVKKTLDAIKRDPGIEMIVQGGANGADALARQWAKENGIHCCTMHANWDFHGAMAGPVRNRAMLLLEPDVVVAFAGGRGTKHMMDAATKAAVPVVDVAMST